MPIPDPRAMGEGLRVVEATREGRLHRVSIDVRPGEIVCLLGPNGAGKTSLMRGIIGWDRLDGGTILIDGRRIDDLPTERRATAGLGVCPEGRRVFSGLTARENLLAGCIADGRERARRLDSVLALFPDLTPHLGRDAWRLSGGQQQMLAIGRALMGAPRVLLLDEPSLGLAPRLIPILFDRLARIASDGVAILLAEQNANAALTIADRAIVLRQGRIVLQGDRDSVAAHVDALTGLGP